MDIVEGKVRVDAYLHSMKAGKVTELEYDGLIFKVVDETPLQEVETKPKQVQLPIDKGKAIDRKHHTTIYDNVLNEIKDCVSPSEIEDIIQKYYVGNKPTSIRAVASVYRKYIENHEEQQKPNRKRRYTRRKPKDSVGFDKTYGVWIKKDHYLSVKKILHRYMFKATTKTISEETKIPLSRVSATLHYLIDKKEAYMKYDEDGFPEYHPT